MEIVHAYSELTIAPPGPTLLRDGDRLMLYGAEDAIEAIALTVVVGAASGVAARPASSALE